MPCGPRRRSSAPPGPSARRPRRWRTRSSRDASASPAARAGGRDAATRRARRRSPTGFRSPFRLEADRAHPRRPAPPARRAGRGHLRVRRRRRPGDPRDGRPRRAGARPGRGCRPGAGGGPRQALEAVRAPGDPARLRERPGERATDRRLDPAGPRTGCWRATRPSASSSTTGRRSPPPLREEAEAIIGEATADHAAMARLGAGLLPDARGPAAPPADPLQHRARSPAARSGRRSASSRRWPRTDGRSTSTSTRRGRGSRAPASRPGSWARRGSRTRSWPTRPPAGCWPRARSTRSSSAPTGSPPTATPRTRSAPTRWPCSRRATACPFHVVAPTATLDGEAADGSADHGRDALARPRSPPSAGERVAPAGAAARQPVVRRHAGGARHGDRHRGRRAAGAVRAGHRRPRSRRARHAGPRPRRAGRTAPGAPASLAAAR